MQPPPRSLLHERNEMDIQKKESEEGGDCTYMRVTTVIAAYGVDHFPSFYGSWSTENEFLS
jgi:hypothetical protein